MAAKKIFGFVSTALWGDSQEPVAKKGKTSEVVPKPFITSGAEEAVEARLQELGYAPHLVRHATQMVGEEMSSLEKTYRELMASHPEGTKISQRLLAPREQPEVASPLDFKQSSPTENHSYNSLLRSSSAVGRVRSSDEASRGYNHSRVSNMDQSEDVLPVNQVRRTLQAEDTDVVLEPHSSALPSVRSPPQKRAREIDDAVFHFSAEELQKRRSPFDDPNEIKNGDGCHSGGSGSGILESCNSGSSSSTVSACGSLSSSSNGRADNFDGSSSNNVSAYGSGSSSNGRADNFDSSISISCFLPQIAETPYGTVRGPPGGPTVPLGVVSNHPCSSSSFPSDVDVLTANLDSRSRSSSNSSSSSISSSSSSISSSSSAGGTSSSSSCSGSSSISSSCSFNGGDSDMFPPQIEERSHGVLGGPPGGPNVSSDGAPVILRNMSNRSQQVLATARSRHIGISHATLTRLLLKTAAALRQGLLTADDRMRLHRHLEDGEVDLVHAIVSSVGCRSEPGLPLEDGEEPWDCAVCFSTQEEQGWVCPSGHKYCGECMRMHVESVAFPRCPALKCGYELMERDFLDLHVPSKRLEAFRSAKLQGAVDVLGKGNAVSGFKGDDVIRCPNPACQNAVLVTHGARLRYECACHAEPFCTSCRQAPYHYHSACADVQQHRHRWLDWISGGRDKYFGLAKASSVYEGQARALREGLLRHEELEADEQWKEKKCRKCPSCGRPVQKLDGCDSMVCGTDAHGGNQQSGCGQSFNWSQAEKYTAQLGTAKKLPEITSEDVRCRGHTTLHAFVDCSLCGRRGILGPRFRCLHCPSFDACKDCEVGLFDVHEPGHVFEIMLESDFAWGGIRLPMGTRVRAVRRGDVLPTDLQMVESKSLEGLCGTISAAPPTPAKTELPKVYEWQSDRGKWHRYDAAATNAIAAAVKRGVYGVQVNSGGRTGYVVDLRAMKQTNQQTGGSRPIRAVVDMAAARAAEDAARALAASAWADPYRITLDDGRQVVLAAGHLEPLLESRTDAEKLMERALQEQEDGIPEPKPEPEEPEDPEGDGADY